MSWRISLARRLLRLSTFVQSLPVVVMRPDDLVEYSRQSYSYAGNVESWAEAGLVDSGLDAEELELLKVIPEHPGDLLLLGVGGGREAIFLARRGFRVTGVDFVEAMVARARENAANRGVQLQGLVQDIACLEVPAESYDVVWLSRSMYSCVPTRRRRVEMVKRIAAALKPGGYFLCQFAWRTNPPPSRREHALRRMIAFCTLGNLAYQPGDRLWGTAEFVHEFNSEAEIRAELEEGGLAIVRLQTNLAQTRGNAVCQKCQVEQV